MLGCAKCEQTPASIACIPNWQMALRAKGHPLPSSSFAASKFDQSVNANIFRVLVPKPLQVLTSLLVISTLALKMRIKAAYLCLKFCHLAFQIRELLFRKSKLLVEYHRRAMLVYQLFDLIKYGHTVVMFGDSAAVAVAWAGFRRWRFG